jgi:hypothetical protein
MERDTREVLAGAIGGLVGRLAVSGLLLAAEAAGVDPASDLVKMQRRAAGKLRRPHRAVEAPATPGEEAVGQGWHLVLSAGLGAVYGLLRRRIDLPPAGAGAAFGLAFYPLAFGLAGPALGLTKRPWEERPTMLVRRALVHLVFGAVTGLATDRAARYL